MLQVTALVSWTVNVYGHTFLVLIKNGCTVCNENIFQDIGMAIISENLNSEGRLRLEEIENNVLFLRIFKRKHKHFYDVCLKCKRLRNQIF